MSEPVVITGIGICSAVGNTVDEFTASLKMARSGLKPYKCVEAPDLVAQVAATDPELDPLERFPDELVKRWDRGTVLAACAAAEALQSAGIERTQFSPARLALASGASGSGQFYPVRTNPLRSPTIDRHTVNLLLNHNVPSFQTNELARAFGFHGPLATVSSASAGSGIAIGLAMRWLQAGVADLVLAGGGEGLLPLNIIGFDRLGILSAGCCSPFNRSDGMSMGEGAGFVVLERISCAERRGAKVLSELYGFAVTSDAFDAIQFDPSGNGIHRAINSALADARMLASDIEWIRASGAGGRSQDAAELTAIENSFGAHKPLVTSLESTIGHTNGAGPAMGLVACVACKQAQLVPATLNFDESLPNEPYDFVPNRPRMESVRSFLSTTAAFGGTNVVLLGGDPRAKAVGPTAKDAICITGVGVVSAQGCGRRDLAARLLDSQCAWEEIDGSAASPGQLFRYGKVNGFDPRRLLSSLRLRGVDSLAQYAAGAVRLAIQDAELPMHGDRDRIGVVTGIARPSNETLEKLLDALEGPWGSLNVSKNLLRKGRFLIASQLANWFGLRGFSATITDGLSTTGLTALLVAAEQLRQSEEVDAIVVVSADHVTHSSLRMWQTLEILATDGRDMLPYREPGSGMFMGEGAVALILERSSTARSRGAAILANVHSYGMSFDSIPVSRGPEHEAWLEVEGSGKWLASAILQALSIGGVRPEEIGFVLGNGCGLPEYDLREQRAIQAVLGDQAVAESINTATGVLEAACSLMAVAAGGVALTMRTPQSTVDKAGALPGTIESPLNSLVVGSSEKGRNVAVVLSSPGS